jgi:hypothetical protein
MVGGWHLKLTFCFMVTSYEMLHLREINFCTMKDSGHTYKFVQTIFSWTDFLNMAMVEFWTTEVDEKLAQVNVEPYNFLRWQTFWGWTTFNNTTFARIQKYEHGGRLDAKIHVLFYGDNSLTVAFR